jgi:flavin reductase (DIM6/NTAB) family NADH-FMN oxidoreductase RutF
MTEKNTKEQISRSLGRVVSGIGILTTFHKNESGAMLASWFQQAGFEPPMISVAIKNGRPISELIQSSKKFVLNILHTGQKNMLAHFGKGFDSGEDPFKGVAIEKHKTGIPILKESLCFLECELKQVYPSSDHQIYLGEVINGGIEEEGSPMVHVRRNGFNY